MKKLWACVFSILSVQTLAAINSEPASQLRSGQQPVSKSGIYYRLAQKKPLKYLSLGEKLFSKERYSKVQTNPTLAREWERRLYFLYGIQAFLSAPEIQNMAGQPQKRIMKILRTALLDDPALYVRDGAVEVVARLMSGNPQFKPYFKKWLETAFLDSKNQVSGEGLFIRETIFMALKESSVKPSKEVLQMAKKDKNSKVRNFARSY